MVEKLKMRLTGQLSNSRRYSTIIEIDKSEYDEATYKFAFLQQIKDEFMSEIVNSGYEILED
ncbi:MAG: hypothetical protein [Bacteriophage sp.]|nr:MAG: hypothetical protein [Bacteriophage sp.]